MPSSNVLALGLDNFGTLWIGTDRGLRTLIKHNNNEVYSAEPIVIEQNGIYEALLTDVRINTIKVDQSNRKWVGTLSSGAFYFSDTGEETILQFNKKNSALPSDIIYDIDVDP
ncbi:two-component regulator propeller domain-containing protein, partial [Rothia aeria]|nr:two-component regulator propeller domain-containing protein [Rothia aeria]